MAAPGQGWLGNVPLSETANGLAVGVVGQNGGIPSRPFPVPFKTPLYDAGVDSGDTIKTIDGQPATSARWNAIAGKKPGDSVKLVVMRRGGEIITRTITVIQDPTARRIVAMENPSPAQKTFRDSWLATKVLP
jgi:predicted metalloprotease with PDZ domain